MSSLVGCSRPRAAASLRRRGRRAAAALGLVLALSLIVAGCGGSGASSSSSAGGSPAASTATSGSGNASSGSSSSSSAEIGFEGVPLELGPPLAPAATTGTRVVDGIHCGPVEQLTYHIHIHLAVFDDGRLYSLPAGIGIPGSVAEATNLGPIAGGGRCIYWLHTHTDDGVIHVESPTARVYTLGDFFDVWRQPLSRRRIARLRGAVYALVDGRPWRRSPRVIPLRPHEDIQLEIGGPAPPVMQVDWARTHL